MPHTSRKKLRGHQKRLELTDSSGWTHITKGTSVQRHQLSQLPLPSGYTGPTVVPLGLNTAKVHDTYDRYQNVWRNSTCFKEMTKILERMLVFSKHVNIDQCVCLGLGSFTGGAAQDASMYELAALASILEILSQKYAVEKIYLQDPVFNPMDEEFLCESGYTVLPTPQGFEKLTPTTFLFAPHLEWPLYIQALQVAIPALCIGNCVREYLEPIREPEHSNTQPDSREILSRFVETTSGVDMPEFDRSSWCTSTSIYWTKTDGEHDPSSPDLEADTNNGQAFNVIAEGPHRVNLKDEGNNNNNKNRHL